jgi:hypothetical protein
MFPLIGATMTDTLDIILVQLVTHLLILSTYST